MESNPVNNLHEKLPDAATVDRAAQGAHDVVDRLAAKAMPAVEKMRTLAGSAGETLQQRADRFVELEEEVLESTRVYVRDNPIKAVGIALAAGLLLARLVR